MLAVDSVNDIRNKRVCFCGRSLIGEFCSIHGTDIRVDSLFIDVKFKMENPSPNLSNSLREMKFDASLPLNQVYSLFKTDLQHQPTAQQVALKEIDYRVKTIRIYENINFNSIIAEFLDINEFEPFLGSYFILRVFNIKQKSGVNIYFLFKHKIISQNEIMLSFSVIPLRRISTYISWRYNHCGGDKKIINRSLTTTRSSIFLENGKRGKIVDLKWEEDKKLPSKIFVIENPKESQKTIRIPSQLFHDKEHFFIGTRKENDACTGLDIIAQHFINQFIKFLKTKSIQCKYNKQRSTKEKYQHLIGLKVSPSYNLLKIIGEYQNRCLSKSMLNKLVLKGFKIKNSKLLVCCCSATKDSSSKRLPAFSRYLGYNYLILKQILLNDLWPDNLDCLIISGKYGLLTPTKKIPFYEQIITQKTIVDVSKLIEDQILNYNFSNYDTCFFNISSIYFQPLEELYNKLLDQGCSVIRVDNENQMNRVKRMLQWIEK